MTVTSWLAAEGSARVAGSSAGGDALVGSLVHRMLQSVPGERVSLELQDVARALLTSEERATADDVQNVIAQATAAYESLRARPDVIELLSGGTVMREVPFSMRLDGLNDPDFTSHPQSLTPNVQSLAPARSNQDLTPDVQSLAPARNNQDLTPDAQSLAPARNNQDLTPDVQGLAPARNNQDLTPDAQRLAPARNNQDLTPGAGTVLRGRIDLLVVRADGSVVVVEFKTGRRRPEHERQLAIYVGAARALFPGRAVEGCLVYP